MEIRDEDGEEYIYGARNKDAEGIKFRVRGGDVVVAATVSTGVGVAAQTIQPDRDHGC